jgi:hypothetical protein
MAFSLPATWSPCATPLLILYYHTLHSVLMLSIHCIRCDSNADCAEYPEWACTRGGLTCVDGKFGGVCDATTGRFSLLIGGVCDATTGRCACVEGQFTVY